MKNTIGGEEIKNKLSEEDISLIQSKCDETIQWLDANLLAEVEEFTYKQRELESLFNPIMTKVHTNNAHTGNTKNGPTIEEMD